MCRELFSKIKFLFKVLFLFLTMTSICINKFVIKIDVRPMTPLY